MWCSQHAKSSGSRIFVEEAEEDKKGHVFMALLWGLRPNNEPRRTSLRPVCVWNDLPPFQSKVEPAEALNTLQASQHGGTEAGFLG